MTERQTERGQFSVRMPRFVGGQVDRELLEACMPQGEFVKGLRSWGGMMRSVLWE